MTTTPRRRVIRSPQATTDATARQRKFAVRRIRLLAEQQNLSRWMSRLKRAFHAVEKQQLKISRLEREITRLETT
ncbi:hypothetical protein [Schlesneria sp.]|uniref:hypothetical protein n=1 Tax=Schlesneria sp. TaxID=2762018 RepID=UPI002EE73DEF